MKEAYEFVSNSIRLIERELFEFIKSRGIGDDGDIEGESDRCRQDTGIHRERA